MIAHRPIQIPSAYTPRHLPRLSWSTTLSEIVVREDGPPAPVIIFFRGVARAAVNLALFATLLASLAVLVVCAGFLMGVV